MSANDPTQTNLISHAMPAWPFDSGEKCQVQRIQTVIFAFVLALNYRAGSFAQNAPRSGAPYCSKTDYAYTGQNESREQQENLCLRVLGRSVKRSGDVLTLQLANGRSKAYRNNQKACDNDDADHCVSYWLVGYHATAHLFILLTGDYDGFGGMFVSALDGTETRLDEPPHFAPDGSSFIVIGRVDSLEGGCFAIGSVRSRPPSLDAWRDFASNDAEYWEFQRWLDNDHIAVKFDRLSETCKSGPCEGVLERAGNDWSLRRKP